MKFTSFNEIESYILNNQLVKTVALACAQDELALQAVVAAKRKGVLNAILIGDCEKLEALLNQMGEDSTDYQCIECLDEQEAGRLAVQMVVEGKANIPMKGLMMTASFMKAILNKEAGFIKEGALLSQATVLEFTEENRLLIISDCAVNITPNVEQKIKITQNAVNLAHHLGINEPNVAVLSALEKVNPKMPSSVDAQAVADYAGYSGIGAIAGPLALDITISREAAEHKGIYNQVCGNADILIMPEITAGNIFTKSLTFFAHLKSCGSLIGTTHPVIMTSRTDTAEDKYFSILVAILNSMN